MSNQFMAHGKQNVDFTYGSVHRLKTWPSYFGEVVMGLKKFEARKNDRGYKIGDILILEEWNPNIEEYTGAKCIRIVRTILHGGVFGIEQGYVVMGIEKF